MQKMTMGTLGHKTLNDYTATTPTSPQGELTYCFLQEVESGRARETGKSQKRPTQP